MKVRDTAVHALGSLVLAAAVGGCAFSGDKPVEPGDPAPAGRNDRSGEGKDDDLGAPAADPGEGEVQETTLHTEWGSFPIKYSIIDGEPIAQGDIVIPLQDPQNLRSGAALNPARRWTDAVVPFVVDANLPGAERVTAAIRHWEANTKLRFVARTNQPNYIHFRSARQCSSSIGMTGRPQAINLMQGETAQTVAAIGTDRTTTPPRVYYYYKRGFATAGSATRADAVSAHFRYAVAPGKSVASLIDVAFDTNGHLFAWYSDGTVSEGSRDDFALHAAARPYVLAEGKTPADVAGFAIDANDRAYAFYTDGTFSGGTATDVAVKDAPEPFVVAPGKTAADLAHVDLAADGSFFAFYTDGKTSTGTAAELAATATGSVRFPGHCSTGSTIHEIGHAMGLFHEQTRADRDDWVIVNFDNIQPSSAHNFSKNSTTSINDVGPYDFESIMHYDSMAFSKNGLPTIVKKSDGSTFRSQRVALSPGDLAGVRFMYP